MLYTSGSGDAKTATLNETTGRAIARWCLRSASLWLLLLAAGLVLLWVSGAFQAEFGEHPDEPAHYVTSLMVRDYIAGGATSSPPMPFAVDYYIHYPKVALGHYPPFLYMVQAAWMLVFPVSRASLLVLNAILIALTGTLLYYVVREEFGHWAGAGAGLLWMALPLVQAYGGMVMAEPLMALLAFGAVVCYGRYLENPRLPSAAAFGLLAALAILTKQVAMFLALLPLVAVPLARRFRLVPRFSFWLPALLVAGLVGPWHLFVLHRVFKMSVASLSGQTLKPVSLATQMDFLVQSTGYVLLVLVAIGFWARIIWPTLRGQPVAGRWSAYAACLVAFVIFRVPAPAAASDSRHLISLQPAMLLFAAAGIAWLSQCLSGRGLDRAKWATVLALAAALGFVLWTFRLPQRRYHGFAEAASLLLKEPGMKDSISMISADASGEGAFVASVAAGDRRSGHIVLRANKMLARTNWNGTEYKARFSTPEDLLHYLESLPVRILAVQVGPGPPGHLHRELVRDMLRRYPDRWKLIGAFPNLRPPSRPGAGVNVYRLAGQEGRPRAPSQSILLRLRGVTRLASPSSW